MVGKQDDRKDEGLQEKVELGTLTKENVIQVRLESHASEPLGHLQCGDAARQ